jgi:hypothetical protein
VLCTHVPKPMVSAFAPGRLIYVKVWSGTCRLSRRLWLEWSQWDFIGVSASTSAPPLGPALPGRRVIVQLLSVFLRGQAS